MPGHPSQPNGTSSTVIWRVYVDSETAVKIELLLADPIRKKPTYGARSALVNSLLLRYLAERDSLREPAQQPTQETAP